MRPHKSKAVEKPAREGAFSLLHVAPWAPDLADHRHAGQRREVEAHKRKAEDAIGRPGQGPVNTLRGGRAAAVNPAQTIAVVV